MRYEIPDTPSWLVEEVDGPLLPPHGGYRKLKSFHVAQLTFDLTVRFCDKFIDKRSRTHDQMVQGARSGVQNIAEGSQASATSKKTEMKLTNVARSSLEELRLDYEDFLRHRGLPLWPMDDPRRQSLIDRRCRTADEIARWAVEIHHGKSGRGGQSGRSGHSGHRGPGGQRKRQQPAGPSYAEIAANAAHVLIKVACSLLDRQLASQAADFEDNGGFTERLYRTRSRSRRRPNP